MKREAVRAFAFLLAFDNRGGGALVCRPRGGGEKKAE